MRQHLHSGGDGDGSQATEYSPPQIRTSAVHQHPTASSIGNHADKVHVIPCVRPAKDHAMKFFKDALKYELDETSPDEAAGEEADVEILSRWAEV